MNLPYDPAIALLGIIQEMKTYFHIETCISMFTVALFKIARSYPHVFLWVNSFKKLVHFYHRILLSNKNQ